MITTLDGATEAHGTSRALGGPADQARLVALRSASDMVLVGAGTARSENYGPPSKRGLRIAVVSRSCNLDFSSPLFSSGAGLVVTTMSAPALPVDSVRAGATEIDFAGALSQIDARLLHVEGGPQLNAALLAADMVDAINLTFSPRLVGVSGRSIADGQFDRQRFTLVSAQHVEEFVFARYERTPRLTA